MGALDEIPSDLPHGAGAHDDEQIARPAPVAQVFDDVVESVDVPSLGAPVAEALHQIIGADEGLLVLGVADEVDVRDDDGVGVAEGLGEFIKQEARSAVLVGLEDAHETTRRALVLAQGAERGVDLGRVVAVVVVDAHAVNFAEQLQAAIDALE